ncbi:MAG: DUF4166 domain-containing protein [Pseudomonadota bacterium]
MLEPIYRTALGASTFDALSPMVQAVHRVGPALTVWEGEVDVERGRSWLAKLGCAVAGLPPEGGGQAITVRFRREGRWERWERVIGAKVFRSFQRVDGDAIVERVGTTDLRMRAYVEEGRLRLKVIGQRTFGVPLPRWLWLTIATAEHEEAREDGARYRFDVRANLPGGALLVHYRGWLRASRAMEDET